jgi:hypothetical protein
MVAIHRGRVFGDADRSKWVVLDGFAAKARVTHLVDELFVRRLARKGKADPESGTYPVLLTDDGEYELIIGGAG